MRKRMRMANSAQICDNAKPHKILQLNTQEKSLTEMAIIRATQNGPRTAKRKITRRHITRISELVDHIPHLIQRNLTTDKPVQQMLN
jgi:hypothetical protein